MTDYVCREVAPPQLSPTCRGYELSKFEDSKLPLEKYFVIHSPDGRWTCSCIGNRNGHDCKHPTFIQVLELAGLVGYMLDSKTMKVHDLFPVPKGKNGLLVEVRGEF